MKKYQKQSGMTVDAEYGEEQGNPFFEALPEILGKEEVMKRLRSQIPYPKDIQKMSPEERRKRSHGDFQVVLSHGLHVYDL